MKSTRRPLSRDRIVAAALDILDREGLDAISMRRLGDRLGVEAMSLYNHVASKADVLDGIFERIVADLPPPPTTGSWQDALRARAGALRDALRRHPGALVLFATRRAVTPASLAQIEATLEILHRAGFSTGRALASLNVIVAYLIGHSLASYGPRQLEDPARPEYGRVASKMPRLRDAVMALPRHDPETEFHYGLDALLAGIEARHRARRAARSRRPGPSRRRAAKPGTPGR